MKIRKILRNGNYRYTSCFIWKKQTGKLRLQLRKLFANGWLLEGYYGRDLPTETQSIAKQTVLANIVRLTKEIDHYRGELIRCSKTEPSNLYIGNLVWPAKHIGNLKMDLGRKKVRFPTHGLEQIVVVVVVAGQTIWPISSN